MIKRALKEESGKVTAKPVVRKGDDVKVFNIYKNRKELVYAATDSKKDVHGQYSFTTRNGTIVTWASDPSKPGWVIDPADQED